MVQRDIAGYSRHNSVEKKTDAKRSEVSAFGGKECFSTLAVPQEKKLPE